MTIYTVYEIDGQNRHNSRTFKIFSTQKAVAKKFFDKHKKDYKEYGNDYNLIFAYYDGNDMEEIDGDALLNFYPIESTIESLE